MTRAGVEQVALRSPATCQSHGGICRQCYGVDMGQKRLVDVGSAVGITAALSLGESLTQLSMRSFHLGHKYPFSKIARGKPEQDIKYSSAFPRLEEVFEMFEKRRAYGPALDGVDERPLPQDVLDRDGEAAAQRYIVDELDRVYGESHVHLDCRHYEIAARQLMSYVEIENPGSTGLLAGQRVRRDVLARINANAARAATAKPLLLPTTEIALRSDSFLAASASWQTVKILADAALRRDTDRLAGMRENIILGRRIPVGEYIRT
jgi:DNA-directed RNA polymerase subunit beta'